MSEITQQNANIDPSVMDTPENESMSDRSKNLLALGSAAIGGFVATSTTPEAGQSFEQLVYGSAALVGGLGYLAHSGAKYVRDTFKSRR